MRGDQRPEMTVPETPRRRFPTLLLTLVALGAVCAYILLHSGFFRVEKVTVIGNRQLPASRVQEAAGVRTGQLLWSFSMDRIARAVQAEPWVAAARVQWRAGELVVQVQERRPVGLLPYQTAYLMLDELGTVLQQVPQLTAAKLPVITGVSIQRALRGERLEDAHLADALYLLSWMDESLRSTVGELNVDPQRNLTFYISGVTVRWGRLPSDNERATETPFKLKHLPENLANAQQSKPPKCIIDMRDKLQWYLSDCN